MRGLTARIRGLCCRAAWLPGLGILIALPGAASDSRHNIAAVPAAVAAHGGNLLERARAHEHGEGVVRDPVRAAALYCEAVRRGNVEAMFALGWMYANARGLPRNDAHASYLFRLAAAKGHEHAQRMLRYTGEKLAERPECLERRLQDWSADRAGSLESRVRALSPERQAVARLVTELAPQYQVSPVLALAIAMTESALNPAAVSPRNAQGVMQLIPETAARFNVRNAFDPSDNIKGGLAYLRWLLAFFEGDVVLAAAAYNAGERAVERYRGVPPFRETRNYVERIMEFVQRRHHPFDRDVASPSTMLPAMRVVEQEVGS